MPTLNEFLEKALNGVNINESKTTKAVDVEIEKLDKIYDQMQRISYNLESAISNITTIPDLSNKDKKMMKYVNNYFKEMETRRLEYGKSLTTFEKHWNDVSRSKDFRKLLFSME